MTDLAVVAPQLTLVQSQSMQKLHRNPFACAPSKYSVKLYTSHLLESFGLKWNDLFLRNKKRSILVYEICRIMIWIRNIRYDIIWFLKFVKWFIRKIFWKIVSLNFYNYFISKINSSSSIIYYYNFDFKIY